MLAFSHILSNYPQHLHPFRKAILREYLQIKILSIIAQHPTHTKICFIGGTALRLMYKSQRFSEDLDFDNWGLTQDAFDSLANHICRYLQYEGLEAAIKLIYKGAYHAEITIPQLLYNNNLSTMTTEKLVITIDTTPQGYAYIPSPVMINTLGHTFLFRTASRDILLSMKRRAMLERVKGRDLYDIVYLLSNNAKTDRGYIQKFYPDIAKTERKNHILTRAKQFDLDALQRDVAPFLFDPTNQSVSLFPQSINQTTFE